jgi:hypothetical protein
MHPLGPFAVCCYSVFKDHSSRPFRQGSRAAQGRDEVRNLTKSKQPVNNFLLQVVRFTALPLLYIPRMARIKCDAPGDRGKLLNHSTPVNQKNDNLCVNLVLYSKPTRQQVSLSTLH